MALQKNLFWIVLSGGISAGVAAYLYATKNGRAFKKDIRRKKELLMDHTNDILNDGKEKAKSFLREAKKHGDMITKEISKVPENYLVPARKVVRNYKRPY